MRLSQRKRSNLSFLPLLMALSLLLGGCGDDTKPVGGADSTIFLPPADGSGGEGPIRGPCQDVDGDGYGLGEGCMGLDCDDADPQVNLLCGVEPLCSGPNDPSCPCPVEGAKVSCFSGHPLLNGVGLCEAGSQTCRVGYWSPCEGEVLPGPEICDGLDNDCDGQADEAAECTPTGPDCLANPSAQGCSCLAATSSCFSGNAALQGVGACRAGSQACVGGIWGPCLGEGLPTVEVCDGQDNDCDGQTDEGILGGCSQPTCVDGDGDGYGQGSGCIGPDCDDLNPTINISCTPPNCNIPGTEGCPCTLGQSMDCFSGDPASQGVGLCRPGLRSCTAGSWGPCSGEVRPALEVCDGLDNDCDGTSDEALAGCGEPGCVDLDHDGYGAGADCLGPDCDDMDPLRHESCHLDCTIPGTEGCPCNAGDTLPCFSGNPALVGTGVCAEGTVSCVGGTFGPCGGEVLPGTEICDELDNDCNGEVDEIPGCLQHASVGGPEAPMEITGENSDGVELSPVGDLMLGQSNEESTFIYTGNSEEGTVSKLDSRTGREVARYASALEVGASVPLWSLRCSGGGNCPSRTAVDLDGNVWVANRAWHSGAQGSVSKIAHNPLDCVDRNDNGIIETSHDANGDGVITYSDPAEFLGGQDECILFTVPVGNIYGIPRALGICTSQDPYQHTAGNPWVGLYNDHTVVELDNETGQILQTVAVPIPPYGAVCNKDGLLWVTTHGAQSGTSCPGIVSVDTLTAAVSPLRVPPNMPSCGQNGCYGISLDEESRVWLGGYPCEGAWRYDGRDDTWLVVETPGRGIGRGISVDTGGMVWLAHSWLLDGTYVGHITGFATSGEGEHVNVDIPDGSCTIGSAIDNDGNVWVVNQSTSNATRYNPTTGALQSFPVGTGPYTYSDFSGYTLRNFTSPSGWYTHLIRGECEEGMSRWLEVTWEEMEPFGTEVYLEAKSAMLPGLLEEQEWSAPLTISPGDLSTLPAGNFLQVRVTMRSEDLLNSPTFGGFQVAYDCL